MKTTVNKATPAEPELPRSLTKKSEWRRNGERFRTSKYCHPHSETHRQSCFNNKVSLINTLSEEQWPFLYHFGFVPIRTPLASYRVHWQFGNNVSPVNFMSGVSTKSLCCYSAEYDFCCDGNVLMQVLALRTDPRRFHGEACTMISVERRVEDAAEGVYF